MKTLKASELVLDFELYPRSNVDPHNIRSIADAITAGVEMPPIVIDKKSRRVVDGFHRVRAAVRVHGELANLVVVEKVYKNESEMFLDSMRYNASHGAKLDQCDRTHCTIIAERLSIPIEAVAGALNMPFDKLANLTVTRVATSSSGLSVPLKRTVSKAFRGKELTKRQEQANERLSGMSQVFYVNQLIELIESEMLDTGDERLMERSQHLHELLDGVLAAV